MSGQADASTIAAIREGVMAYVKGAPSEPSVGQEGGASILPVLLALNFACLVLLGAYVVLRQPAPPPQAAGVEILFYDPGTVLDEYIAARLPPERMQQVLDAALEQASQRGVVVFAADASSLLTEPAGRMFRFSDFVNVQVNRHEGATAPGNQN